MKFQVNQVVETAFFKSVRNTKGKMVQRTQSVKLQPNTTYNGSQELFDRLSDLGYAVAVDEGAEAIDL